MRYYVEQKYYNAGQTEATILLESEVIGSGDEHERYSAAKIGESLHEEHDNFDLYVDVFNTWEDAEDFRKDALNA